MIHGVPPCWDGVAVMIRVQPRPLFAVYVEGMVPPSSLLVVVKTPVKCMYL